MKIGSAQLRIEWGHLAFVAVIAAFCLWYWQDARAASTDIQNLLLIQPAAILALALCAAVVSRAIRLEDAEPSADEPPAAAASEPPHGREWRGIVVASLLLLYVIALLPVGFDVATFVFLAVSMFTLGERRPLFLLGYSAVLAVGLSYGFKVVLSVPVPTLLF